VLTMCVYGEASSQNSMSLHCTLNWGGVQVSLLHALTNHCNVVKFYNWYETSKHLWLISELCVTGSLLNIINTDGPIPERFVIGFVEDILDGLNYLHSTGIIFCDFHPKHYLLDSVGVVKLADFGAARRYDPKVCELIDGCVCFYVHVCVGGGGANVCTSYLIGRSVWRGVECMC